MIVDCRDWDAFLEERARAGEDIHLLQTSAWGELKRDFGWQAHRFVCGGSGAQVLLRVLVPRLGKYSPTVAYVPRGPIGNDWSAVLAELDEFCRAHRTVFLKLEPDYWEEDFPAALDPEALGLLRSAHAIQPPRTVLVDITGEEERILAEMKQKTRYNVRLSQKKGVSVRPCSDLSVFQDLMLVTGTRDGFGVHSQAYYQRVYDLFHLKDGEQAKPGQAHCEILLAEAEGQPLAALMAFACGKRAYYLYGASNDNQREKMPTYLIQWEAMRWGRSYGCTEYDLWGIPDENEDTLEAHFTERHDGLWGVYRFKRGFGGRVLRAAGPWDKVYNSPLYRLYQWRMGRADQSPMGG